MWPQYIALVKQLSSLRKISQLSRTVPIKRKTLENALAPLNPRFVNLTDLKKKNTLAEGDLFVLPYGSALPADAWETIHTHLEHGNLLVLGGRPFFVPVYRDSSGWRIDYPQNTYSRSLGIEHSYVIPQQGDIKFAVG